MQNGQLLSDKVLPNLGKAFKAIANENGMLTQSLAKGLQKQLINAKNSADVFTNTIYSGMLPYLRVMFNESTKATDALQFMGNAIGKTLGEALFWVITPFKLAGAAIHDMVQYFMDLTNTAGDAGTVLAEVASNWIPRLLGMTLAVWALVKAFRVLKGAIGAVKIGGKVIESVMDRTSGAGGKDGIMGKLGYGTQLNTIIAILRQIAINTGGGLTDDLMGSGGNTKGKTGRAPRSKWENIRSKTLGAAALTGAGILLQQDYDPDSMFNQMRPKPVVGMSQQQADNPIISFLGKYIEMLSGIKFSADINLNTDLLNGQIDARVDHKNAEMLKDTAQHIQGN